MNFKDKIKTICDILSNTLIFIYFFSMVLLVSLIALHFLEPPNVDENSILKYSEVLATTVLVGATLVYAYDNNRMYKQANKTQQISHIERKLEFLYYPLKICLNRYSDIEKNIKSADYVLNIKNDLCEIIPHMYLASNDLKNPLNRFISIFDKNGYLIKEEINKKLGRAVGLATDESTIETAKLHKAMLLTIDSSVWEKIDGYETKEVLDLYKQILSIIENDITSYQEKLEKLTIVPK